MFSTDEGTAAPPEGDIAALAAKVQRSSGGVGGKKKASKKSQELQESLAQVGSRPLFFCVSVLSNHEQRTCSIKYLRLQSPLHSYPNRFVSIKIHHSCLCVYVFCRRKIRFSHGSDVQRARSLKLIFLDKLGFLEWKADQDHRLVQLQEVFVQNCCTLQVLLTLCEGEEEETFTESSHSLHALLQLTATQSCCREPWHWWVDMFALGLNSQFWTWSLCMTLISVLSGTWPSLTLKLLVAARSGTATLGNPKTSMQNRCSLSCLSFFVAQQGDSCALVMYFLCFG